jgi:hypothetical protein
MAALEVYRSRSHLEGGSWELVADEAGRTMHRCV